MATQRLKPVADQFRIAKEATLEATRQVLIATAKREHRRVLEADPQPMRFSRFVDGTEGASEEAVKPLGIIVYEYPRLDLVIAAAEQVLFDLSPFGFPEGGHYRDEHHLFLDGSPAISAANWRPGQEAMIVNTQPYARMIEVGAMRMVVPGTDHVYAQAQQILRRKYSSLAYIRFTYSGGHPALIIRER